MLADPWINWCAQGTDGKIYALEVCDAVESDKLGYEIDGVMVSDFITPAWFEPTRADRVDFKHQLRNRWNLPREDTSPCWTRPGDGRKLRRGTSLQRPFRWEAGYNGATWERRSGGEVSTGFNYFLRQRTPSLVISTRSPAVVSSARIASEA